MNDFWQVEAAINVEKEGIMSPVSSNKWVGSRVRVQIVQERQHWEFAGDVMSESTEDGESGLSVLQKQFVTVGAGFVIRTLDGDELVVVSLLLPHLVPRSDCT